jgi:hypothetical protein
VLGATGRPILSFHNRRRAQLQHKFTLVAIADLVAAQVAAAATAAALTDPGAGPAPG